MNNINNLIGVLLCSFSVLTLHSDMWFLESQAIATNTSFVESWNHPWIVCIDSPRLLQGFAICGFLSRDKTVQAPIKDSGNKLVLAKFSEYLTPPPVITLFRPLNTKDAIVVDGCLQYFDTGLPNQAKLTNPSSNKLPRRRSPLAIQSLQWATTGTWNTDP